MIDALIGRFLRTFSRENLEKNNLTECTKDFWDTYCTHYSVLRLIPEYGFYDFSAFGRHSTQTRRFAFIMPLNGGYERILK